MADNKPGEIQRGLESGGNLYINKWWTGLYKNRSPLFTPVSALGIQLIARQDALWDGLNMTVTPQFTVKRRYGHLKASSVAFGASEWPLTWFDFQKLDGSITLLADTQTNVYTWTSSTKTSIYTKAGGADQSSFVDVANTLYWVDGVNAKKWDGTTVSNMGIATPLTAPTLSFTSGSLSPKVGYHYVYDYVNSSTGTTSSASPFSASTGPQTSQNIVVGGARCTDTQCDKIDIYRTLDGGAVYYFLARINNPGSGSWTYTDSTSDSGLNDLLIAPILGVNNPPAAGMSLLVWFAGRLWGASGNTLYYSTGPDTLNGVQEEAWAPGNNYTLPGAITALAATSQGLIIWTIDDAYVLTGDSAANFTVPNLWQKNWGVQNQNCVCQDGDNLFIISSKGLVFNFGASGLTETGFPIGAQLGAFTPSDCYIVMHRSGADEGIFISDGSANMYRYSQVSNSWDPVYQPVGGCGALYSAEISPENWVLLVGRSTGSGYTLKRDTGTWSDDGTAYTCFTTVGSVVVAPPRQVANIESVLGQFVAVGTYPTVSVLLNEIADTGTPPAVFTTLPNPVPDPPQLQATQSIWTKRHDLKAAQSPLPGHVQHLQIKVAFTAEAQPNEIYGIGLAHRQ